MVDVLLFFFAQAASHGGLPQLEDYKVTNVYTGKPSPPVLANREQRLYRTVIRKAAATGPNFAGHYTIAEWDLGSNIGEFAIIDAQTGSVHIPFRTVAFPPMFTYVDDPKLPPQAQVFHLDSRLLLIRGCPDERGCGSYFFEWTGAALKLLRRIPALPSN